MQKSSFPVAKSVDPTSNPLVKVNEAAVKMSKRKEKDLQKYITKKIKKEERSSLFERLQKATVDRDSLQSSRSLGQGVKEKSKPVHLIDIQESFGSSDDSDESSDDEYESSYNSGGGVF